MIRQLHETLLKKEWTAEELTERYLAAIRCADTRLCSYITVSSEKALEAARRTDCKLAQNEPIGILEGIPLSIKDNISVKGMPATCGSRMLEHYRPVYDADAVERLKCAGAVLLGKSNMDEFGMGSTGATSYYGRTEHPYRHGFVAGGSSGGAATGIAADLAVCGLGSDTGGSVRLPAAFCGIVGLKPTYGSVSRYGLIAYASSLDQIGVLAKNAEDTAILFDAVSGYDRRDATSSRHCRISAVAGLNQPLRGKRIALLTDLFQMLPSELHPIFSKVVSEFRLLGAEITEVCIPHLSQAFSAYYILACSECASNLARYDGVRYGFRTDEFDSPEDMITKSRREGFGREVKRRIMLGNYFLRAERYDTYYQRAVQIRRNITCEMEQRLEKADMLICPSALTTAYPFEQQEDATLIYQTDCCTVPASLSGLPAVSVPCGVDASGLPLGIQLIGKRFCEHTVLNAAYQYEQVSSDVRRVETGGDFFGI